MGKDRKLCPEWLVQYMMVQNVSDLVCKVRIGTRDKCLNVEQLLVKLCRATREQLLSRRRER
jgi:predicted GIY-YIG superfamily endonuclease